ncbi:hypothetical protein MVEN_00154800 [Mycena venus]|uniref:DUF1793-domain-containing protein n=1 Tax=Mycena venus TaxID=2733690 RepID=A0A8H7DAI6_9AGAR|nr:hypothetical protein MVEN_00154800 [Mycena venus]
MLCRNSLIRLGILQLWSTWFAPAFAQQTFFPSAVPLAVRTPTFNCWLDTNNGSNPMTNWPTFWNDLHILGWAGYIKVDGLTYHWLGDPVPGNASTWVATQVTPTRTILTVQAGPMQLNVTFLSPIEPNDWALQSFPFSYVYLDGKATDGKTHSIQLYSDISGEWVTNDFGTGIQWSTSQTSNTVYHQVGSTTPTSVFTDVAEDSVAYHAISRTQPNLISVVGTDQQLRTQFAAPGAGFTLSSDLAGQIGNVRGGDGKFPVLAHAMNLGTTDTISSVAWAVGVIRDPITTFAGTQRRAYYWSQHAVIGDAIDAFMADFPAAVTRAIALDQKILQDASAVSQNYADLISLGTRQAMAGLEITLSTSSDGTFNFSDVKAFMKDVGNSGRVNPTEAIYAALPAFMYLNASITGALLEPLLEYQSSSAYTNSYAAPDLGTAYPAVPGNPNNNAVYGIENSGNMLILVLAHARSSGDGSLIGKYYNLLKSWGDYLSTNALIPAQQTSADARDTGLAQTHGNVTNLALKGIIAVQAMSEISQLMGQTADAQKYATTAKNSMQSWVGLTTLPSGQLRWTYGDTTYGLMYNLLADKLLQLNLVPSSVYSGESTTLTKIAAQETFGFPLSNDSNSNARSDWTSFSAAAAPDTATRNLLISSVRKYASSNLTKGTFPTLYNAQNGAGPGAGGSSERFCKPGTRSDVLCSGIEVVTNKTVVVPPPATSAAPSGSSGGGSKKKKSNAGAIAGGIIGGLAALFLGAGIVIFMRRRGRRRDLNDGLEAPRPYQASPNMAGLFGGSSVIATSPSSDSPAVPPSQAPDAHTFPLAHKTALAGGSRNVAIPMSPASSHPSSSQPPSSHQPPSSAAGSSVSRRTDEDLRTEMRRLRQEVEELRATQGVPQEAPPGYQ